MNACVVCVAIGVITVLLALSPAAYTVYRLHKDRDK